MTIELESVYERSSHQETTVAEEWYWKHRGDLLGPIDTEALGKLISEHRVADHDKIRLSTSTEWMTGAEIKAMFAGDVQQATTSEAAAALLTRTTRLQQGHSSHREGFISSIASRIYRIAEGLFESLGGLRGPVVKICVVCLSLFKLLLNRFVILFFVVIGLGTVIAVQVRTGSSAVNHRVLNELDSTWEKFKTLKTAEASTSEFQAFKEATLPEVEKNLAVLMRDSKQDPGPLAATFPSMMPPDQQWKIINTRRALIQALAAMKTMLTEQKKDDEESPSVEIFQKQLAAARGVVNGTQLRFPPESNPRTRPVQPVSEKK